jgi:poly-gamma-glutamate capsule biosynthesis protein CapA/YwtB (metallophosphatase superfamily)
MAIRIAGIADIVPPSVRKPLPESPFFEHLRSAALTVGNLEVPLTSRLDPQHEGIVLASPQSFAAELPRMGLTVAAIANNHILGHGRPGVDDTIAACTGAGVPTVGFGENRREASEPLYIEKDGVKIAIVNATTVGPPDSFATDSRAGVSAIRVETSRKDDPRLHGNPGSIGIAITAPDETDMALLEEQVRAAKAQTPVVIAVIHWGLGEAVLDYMRMIARRCIDAGASVVFGHHSHRLAAVDWYNGAPIYYGLGSFLFQYDGDAPVHIPRDAAVALVDIDAASGGVEHAELVIGRLDDDGVPVPASKERIERVAEDVWRLSASNPVDVQITEMGCAIGPKVAVAV